MRYIIVLYYILALYFQMGNNPITTAGCVALAAAIYGSDTSILETLDLKVNLHWNVSNLT